MNLKLDEKAGGQIGERSSSGPAPACATKSLKPRALAVEDSRAHRMIVTSYLTDLGFEVTEAVDGMDGLARLKGGAPFDVLLVDWEMPQLNGIEFVRAVRQQPAFRELPIIMVTSVDSLDRIGQALEAGANEYIMKPFTKLVLAVKLDMLRIAHA